MTKHDQPLGFPAGTVRALLALLVVSSAIAGVFVLDESRSGLLLALAGAVIAFYFRARSEETTDGDGL